MMPKHYWHLLNKTNHSLFMFNNKNTISLALNYKLHCIVLMSRPWTIHTGEDWPGWWCSRYISATRRQSGSEDDQTGSGLASHNFTSMLASLESRMRNVAAVSSRLYFFMKFLVDLERRTSWQSRGYKSSWHWLERSTSVWHLRRAGVCGASLLPVVQLAGLLEHKVSVSVVSVTFRQDKREEELKNNLSVIHRVSGDVGNKPVPELRQGPAK